MPQLLPFHALWERHTGLTRAIGDGYTEAARVCLDRHHTSPVAFSVQGVGHASDAVAEWQPTDARTKGAWANEIDATEGGAYGLALAAVELSERMVAIRRAENGTGADYYIAPIGVAVEDLEDCFRLEVSGTDHGDKATIQQRLQEKIQQALAGNSNLPAIASVVGFRARSVVSTRAVAP